MAVDSPFQSHVILGLAFECDFPGRPFVVYRYGAGTFNGPIPPAASVLPKGLKWRKKAVDDADFINNVWMLKKQTDPEAVPPATLAQFAVRYLATPEATAEFRAMQGDPAEGGEAAPEDEAASDESGS